MEAEKRRLKVLFTIPNFDTAGSGKALLNIASRLNPELFYPMIACESDAGVFFNVVKQSGIPIHIFKLTTPMGNRLRGLLNAFTIAKHFRKIKPDVVHSFHYSADYSEALAARLAGCKWIYTKKNMNWGGSSKNGWRLRSWLASGIIAQNTDMLIDFFPGWKKVSLIPRGVNIKEFENTIAQGEKVRRELGIKPNERIILSVANLVPVKGIEILIKSFSMLMEHLNDVQLVIVGDDTSDYANSLKKLVTTFSLDHRIHFVGKRSDVKDFLAAASVFVLPTLQEGRQEGSPVALLEAMAAGKYVLASNVSGIRDQLKDFKSHLITPGDPSDLFTKLSDVLNSDQSLLINGGRRLKENVIDSFSIEIEVKKHEDFYLNVVIGRLSNHQTSL